MDITQTQTPASVTGPAGAPSADAGTDQRLINSDFETFLTMLTTQMQNQDPLNPIESTDFATQLATFSGVEQQVRTNDLLAQLQTGMSLMGMGQLSGWVGMEARADMPAAFDGAPLTLATTPSSLADRMELVVTDAQGLEVQRLNIPITDEPMIWGGVRPDGTPLPAGIYRFTTEAFAGDQLLESAPAQVFARVEEAFLNDGETWLTLAGGIRVAADEVQGIRAPF